MQGQPAVSCICLTYGRPAVLEEAIYSFLQQDYRGTKELIVLNDYVDQTLAFAHPEVRVINVPKRFHTVGEKMNAAVALATHDLLFVWDDDDIYLPHRLTFSVDHFDADKGFFKPDQAWVLHDGELRGPKYNIFTSRAVGRASCSTRYVVIRRKAPAMICSLNNAWPSILPTPSAPTRSSQKRSTISTVGGHRLVSHECLWSQATGHEYGPTTSGSIYSTSGTPG